MLPPKSEAFATNLEKGKSIKRLRISEPTDWNPHIHRCDECTCQMLNASLINLVNSPSPCAWRSIRSLCGVTTDSFAKRCNDVERFTLANGVRIGTVPRHATKSQESRPKVWKGWIRMKWKGLEKAQSYSRKRTCEISSVPCVHEEWEWMSAWILHSLSLHQSSQIHIVNTHLHHSLPGIGAFPFPKTFALFQGLGRLTAQKRLLVCDLSYNPLVELQKKILEMKPDENTSWKQMHQAVCKIQFCGVTSSIASFMKWS